MKKHYYHITQKEWEKEVTLFPRKIGDNRPNEEPKTARICVAPTLAHCLIALGQSLSEHCFLFVYRTKHPVKAESPYGVADSHITKEMWLKTPTQFKRVRTFSDKELDSLYSLLPCQVGERDRNVLANQKRSLEKLQKELVKKTISRTKKPN